MRSLFWKIFLSVLLTILLTAGGSLMIAVWLMPRPPMGPHGLGGPTPRDDEDEPNPMLIWQERLRDIFIAHTEQVQQIWNDKGSEAAAQYLNTLALTWDLDAMLVDESLTSLDGRALSMTAGEVAQQALQSRQLQTGNADSQIAVAIPLDTNSEQQIVMVGETHEMPPPPPSAFAWMMLLRIGPVVLGLSLVSYFLTRSITRPLTQMRTSLRQFSQGDLQQRLTLDIVSRHDEIGELARDFDQMAERIATLVNAQQRLLHDVSHELRSPLARQRVALELVRENDGVDADYALERAQREAERLEELISELLRLSRLESDHGRSARGSIDLAALIREVSDNAEFETLQDARSVQLTRVDACWIHGIPELLRRAIENVVRNALRYTAEGTAVEVSVQQLGSEVVVHVTDHGPGVPEAELHNIFRPFYRVSRARERETGGVGLGLAITARAVHSHGGSVAAQNRPGGGLCIEIRLPSSETPQTVSRSSLTTE